MKQPDKFDVYRQIVERAWSDPAFKKRLLENPKEVFKEFGLRYRGEVRILEDDCEPPTFFLPKDDKCFIC